MFKFSQKTLACLYFTLDNPVFSAEVVSPTRLVWRVMEVRQAIQATALLMASGAQARYYKDSRASQWILEVTT